MKNKYENTYTNRCNCKKEDKVTSTNSSINYQRCEELASQSQALYNQALGYKKRIEKYSSMAFQAESKAKKLEEEAQAAWWEYNEFMENAKIAAAKGEELIKASCKLLQESKDCYSSLNFHNNVSNRGK